MRDKGLVIAFKAARKRIASGTDKYICHALLYLNLNGYVSENTYERAKALLEKRLGRLHSLESWLLVEHKIDCRNYYARIRVTRLAWLDSLIKEFS